MQNARFYPDIITHTSVVDAYVKRGDVASALQYFEQNVKVKPDVIIFTSLLDGVARLKKNLANKIFGYLARCEFWLKLGW